MQTSTLKTGLICLGLAIAAGLAWLCWHAMTPATPAPQTVFTLMSGEKVRTADLQGKVAIVNFWATDCSTCMQEMPKMVDTYSKLKGKGLEFVAVAMAYDPPMYVVNFAQTRKLPFRVALDADGANAKAFGQVQLTPTTFVIDKRGNIIKRYVGEPDWASFQALLEKSLAEAA